MVNVHSTYRMVSNCRPKYFLNLRVYLNCIFFGSIPLNLVLCCGVLELLAFATDLPDRKVLDILIEDVEGLDPIPVDMEGCEVIALAPEVEETSTWSVNSAECSVV